MTSQESRRSACCALLFTIRYLDESTDSLEALLEACGQPESIAGRVAECFSNPRGVMSERVIRVRDKQAMASGIVPDKSMHLKDLNPFEELGVTCEVTKEAIDKAYKQLARLRHPDKNGGSTESMQRLNHAKEYLLAMGTEKTWSETHPKAWPGDWVRLADGRCGQVLEWTGREMLVLVDSQTIGVRGSELEALPDPCIDFSRSTAMYVAGMTPHVAAAASTTVPDMTPHAAAARDMPTEIYHGKLPCIGPGEGKKCSVEAWLSGRRWRRRCRICAAAGGQVYE